MEDLGVVRKLHNNTLSLSLSLSLPPPHLLCVHAHPAIPCLLFIFHMQLLKLQPCDIFFSHIPMLKAKVNNDKNVSLLLTELFHRSIFSQVSLLGLCHSTACRHDKESNWVDSQHSLSECQKFMHIQPINISISLITQIIRYTEVDKSRCIAVSTRNTVYSCIIMY